MVEDVKMKTSLGYASICREVEVPYTSLMRWRSRARRGLTLWEPPGPKKVPRMNLTLLEAEIRSLPAGRKRTRGTGVLLKKYAPDISRRKLMGMVEAVRWELAQEERAAMTRIDWKVPGVVSSMDETELQGHPDADKSTLLSSLDLGARYVFAPRVAKGPAKGEEVAAALRRQFKTHGAPLFYKRDNGANLNAAAVNEVLEEFGVLPLNSPPYYSPYNGGMERAHQDVDAALATVLRGLQGDLHAAAEIAVHELNHKPRRILRGRVPCQAFHGRGRRRYGKQERRIVYEWMREKTAAILEAVPNNSLSFDAAWRSAALVWLESQGIIRVYKPTKSVTPFFPCSVS